MDILTLLLLLILGAGGFGVFIYNRLIALRQSRNNAFADIDVQLNLRYDLVPNLVETVKGYAAHESDVFKAVTEARAGAMDAQGESLRQRSAAEGAFGAALMNLMAVAENYPQLKANENFKALQTELSDIENKIAAARRFYNNATNEFNTAIQQFPGNILAEIFQFKQESYFEINQGKRDTLERSPKVSFTTPAD